MTKRVPHCPDKTRLCVCFHWIRNLTMPSEAVMKNLRSLKGRILSIGKIWSIRRWRSRNSKINFKRYVREREREGGILKGTYIILSFVFTAGLVKDCWHREGVWGVDKFDPKTWGKYSTSAKTIVGWRKSPGGDLREFKRWVFFLLFSLYKILKFSLFQQFLPNQGLW